MAKINMADLSDLYCNIDKMDIDELFDSAVQYFNSGNIRSAKNAYFMFQKVIEKNPKFEGSGRDNPYFYLGRFHDYYLNDFDTAIEYYTKSIDLWPEDNEAFENRGFCWLRKAELEKALADFRSVEKIGEGYHPDFDSIIKETENRLNGNKPNKDYDQYF